MIWIKFRQVLNNNYRLFVSIVYIQETARYVKIPQIIDFTDKDGNDTMQQQIDANYYRIKNEVRQIVADEIERIKADPELSHLIKDK